MMGQHFRVFLCMELYPVITDNKGDLLTIGHTVDGSDKLRARVSDRRRANVTAIRTNLGC